MPVIVISRELGSEARDIAEKVAQKLGYHFVDKAVITRILGEYGLVDFDKVADSVPGFWDRVDSQREEHREEMANMLNRVLLTLAAHGDMVILGRGGFALLGGFADVLRVRIQAPRPIRVKRVMEDQNIIAPDRAQKVVDASDRAQAAFVKWFQGARLNAAESFDVVLDTSKVDPELAVTWLVEEAEFLTRKEVTGQPRTDTIQVDPVLDSVVSKELKRQVARTY